MLVKNDTEEFDLIKIFIKFGVDIFRHFRSFMPSVDVTYHLIFMARESLLFGMHGCLSPSEQNLRIHLYIEENVKRLELFILYVYVGKDHRNTDVNKAKRTSFSKSPDPELNYGYQKMLYLST